MNPVLLKPQSEIGAQVIVQGKVFGTATAREMQDLKPKLLPYVLESFEIISATRTSFWSKGRAARRKSTCARTTSPIWALLAPPTCRWW